MLSLQEIEKEKIFKPDFSSKSGRELLAFYLQTKFKQIFLYDKKQESPIINAISPDFITRFTKRIINNPAKRLLIGVTGESASGKSTICSEIQNVIGQFNMPVTVLSTDNYFCDGTRYYNKSYRIVGHICFCNFRNTTCCSKAL